jgi:hypothetical protein
VIWWAKTLERGGAACLGAAVAFGYTVCVHGVGSLATPAFYLIGGCALFIIADFLRGRAHKHGIA